MKAVFWLAERLATVWGLCYHTAPLWQAVITSTHSVTGDDKVGIMTNFGMHCTLSLIVWTTDAVLVWNSACRVWLRPGGYAANFPRSVIFPVFVCLFFSKLWKYWPLVECHVHFFASAGWHMLNYIKGSTFASRKLDVPEIAMCVPTLCQIYQTQCQSILRYILMINF